MKDASPAEYPFVHRFVEVDGHRIHYVDEGAGPAVVFVNVGLWSFIFRDLIVRSRTAFRCVALDFPGLGLSIAARGYTPSVATNSRVLESFIDGLGLRDAILLVHDIGGPVGLGLAARRPTLFRGLVICQTFAWPLREYPWLRRALRLVTSPASRFVNVNFGVLFAVTASSFGAGRHLSTEGRRTLRAPWRARIARTMTLRNFASALDAEPELELISSALRTSLHEMPVLTVFGERNDPFRWQARYGRTFANVRAVRVPGGNHFPFADDPDLVATELARWWRDAVATDASERMRSA